MDLFSQAEHDELAQSILLCPDAGYIDAVQAAIDRLLPTMPRARRHPRLARRPRRADPHALDGRGLRDQQPHRARAPGGQRARAAALGAAAASTPARSSSARFTSESLGDYCAGPNHVLPTAGTARFSSPLGVYDFQKRSSLIEVSEAGAQRAGPRSRPSWRTARACRPMRARRELRLGQPDAVRADAQRGVRSAPGQPTANVDELIKLEDAAEPQERFVASVREVAGAGLGAYEPADRWAIYADGHPVGFLLLWDARRDPEPERPRRRSSTCGA